MPDPADLLSVAHALLHQAGSSSPIDAALRRAASTAYYAVFHKVLRAAAERFMGQHQQTSPGYAILYRSFEHGHMRAVCEALRAPRLGPKLQRQLRRNSVSRDMRDFAVAFPDLQSARHRADYDPDYLLVPSNVASLIDQAAEAMAAFDRVAAAELTDVLTLLMVKSRD